VRRSVAFCAARTIDKRVARQANGSGPAEGIYMAETIFAQIINGKIPAKFVYEDDQYVVINDVAPQAPVHLLVIPRRAIATLNDLRPGDEALIGGMFLVAAKVMRELGQTDFRTVFNCGPGAQQSVFHLHLHVLAGRPFEWPPG
jgi:histidine triad (HIT) family protein